MPPLLKWKNRQLIVPLAPLLTNALEKTYLSADMAVGTAMTVKSQRGFHATTNQPIVIGEFGGKTTELVESTTSSSPTTITLAAASIFAHYMGDPVYLLKYNQIEFSHATTLTGSKTVLTAASGLYSITPDKLEFVLDETEFTSGYYFARFKETVGGTFSGYSDGIQYGTWDRASVGYMIDRALRDLKTSLSENITLLDCYEWINSGLKLIQGKLKRWPEHYSYNAVLGQVSRGTNIIAMPTDAYDLETNKSLIAVRAGTGAKMTYVDPVSFENVMEGVKRTQVTTQAVANQTTLEIDNSYDFADSGTVNVYISGTKYSVSYTGVTRSATAGILTGVPASGTGSISVTIAVDVYVWQDEVEGIPEVFTVRNSNIEFYPLADGSHDNENLYGDYSKVVTVVDSDGDTIDLQRYDMMQSYLTFRMKMKDKNDGSLDMQDGHYLDYKERLNDSIRTLGTAVVFKMRPRINRMSKHGDSSFLRKANLNDLDINSQ